MKRFDTRRRVEHSAGDMFALVADVEAYPQFVPLCTALKVIRHSEDAAGRPVVTADMTVAYKLIRETYRSRVTLDEPAMAIDVVNMDGPFERLENHWRFHALDDTSCEVEFHLVYGFRSKMFERVAGVVFDRAFSRFADAFETRADVVYGKATSA